MQQSARMLLKAYPIVWILFLADVIIIAYAAISQSPIISGLSFIYTILLLAYVKINERKLRLINFLIKKKKETKTHAMEEHTVLS